MNFEQIEENVLVRMKDLKSVRLNRDVLTFLVCILISSSFWCLRGLNGTMTTTLKIPISLVKIPKGMTLYKSSNQYIDVEVTDKGFSIMSYKFTKFFSPIIFDLSSINGDENNLHLVYSLKNLESKIKAQLYPTTLVAAVSPDSIYFDLSPSRVKKVPVLFNGTISVAKQRVQGAVNFDPDSVSITGIAAIIDSIHGVYMEPQVFQNISDSVKQIVNVKSISGVMESITNVKLTIPVEPYTEESVIVPVHGINFPDSLTFRPMPGVVKIIFNVPLSMNVSASDFDIAIDYNNTSILTGETLFLNLRTKPNRIFNVRIDPPQIDYFIEQK